MILRVLQASYVMNNTLLQRNFTVNKGTKAVIFYFIEIFPKPAKMLHILQCEFFLKAPL